MSSTAVYRPLAICARCKRLTPTHKAGVKQCDCCHAFYCSTDCFEATKTENPKLILPGAQGGSNPSWYEPATYEATQGLHAAPGQPFTRLDRGTYLHDRPRLDVFRLLLDCYRLRLDDDIKIYGIPVPATLRHGFHRFLDLAAQRPNLLPPWWDDEAVVECLTIFDTGDNDPAAEEWSTLAHRVSSAEVNTHYGNAYMDVQLRLLGEVVYQRAPGNQKGKEILDMMVEHERRAQGG
ncbi:putative MYND domain protein [Parachaetomium inaequale]|uniref:MYND domain protein n=1 Tax=Parachaetomium inaequale TaxID=2588326 RepID=A0AAN6P950_9PEZI|nr:putative MYND domain protein [Parachaetomium inaequale]